MNNPHRLTNTSTVQIRITTAFRDRLEELRRAKQPRVPPMAALVKEILEKALDEPTED
jgi:hypothetical protein